MIRKLLVAGLLLRMLVAGQTPGAASRTPSGARLTIESRTVPVMVRLDTAFLGATPLVDVPVSPGRHVLRCYPSELQSWFFAPTVETLDVAPAGSVRRSLQPLLSYRITSEPWGADVLIGDSAIGVTPCVLATPDTMGVVRFLLEGYQKDEAVFSASQPHVHVFLAPLQEQGPPGAPGSLASGLPQRQMPIYLSTAATVITGIAAVYLKMKADSYYQDYQSTGNSGTLSRVRAYDTASGIALAASEISFLTLTVVLLSR